MPSIQDAIATRLNAAAGLTALVGARIYWRRAPQKVLCPCVVYKRISGEPVRAMGADTGLQLSRWVIVALGDPNTDPTPATTAELVRLQVKATLNRLHDTTVAGVFIDSIFFDDTQDVELDDETLLEAVADVYRINYRE